MAIGSLEILFGVLVAMVAGGIYWLAVVLLGRGGIKTVRIDTMPIFGLPVIFFIAATVTPPDMVSLMILAVPLCMLYTLAVGIWLFTRYRERLLSRRDGQDSDDGAET